MKGITLKKGRDVSVIRQHPWIFSGGVHSFDEDLVNGEVICIKDHRANILGVGHFHNGSISARILSFENRVLDGTFWNERIQLAFELRSSLGLIGNTSTNCYRLVNAEGDGLSGLIVDIYGSSAVIQCHTVGMYNHLSEIANSLRQTYRSKIDTIYDKNKLGPSFDSHHLLGDKTDGTVSENDMKFKVNWVQGQKTGFFLDQRDSRKLLGTYARNKTVLNTFCYTGGFSVYAQKNGASQIDSVDVSESAIMLTKENMDLNSEMDNPQRKEICADVMKFLKESNDQYDILVVDPPAFAKSQRKRHNAVQAYKRLNALAIKRVKSGGMVFTFSCSQVVSRSLFTDTLRAAAIESGRTIQILHYLSQPADHPSNIYHPEGAYLKGLVLRII